MSIRSRLILLVLAVLTPALLAALFAIDFVYNQQQARAQQGMREATRALSLALDRELARRDAIVSTLVTSRSLFHGNLAEFYEQARQVAVSHENSIILFTPDGRQLINTRRAYGEPLPGRESFLISSPSDGTRSLPVSDLYMAPLGQQPSFGLRRPVLRDNQPIYYVTMGSFASQINSILAEQQLPAGWLGSIVDGQGNIVARNIDPQRFIGQRASAAFRKVILDGPSEGLLESVSLDGTPLLSFFSRAPDSGWTVIIGVPRSELQRSTAQAVLFVIGGSLLLLASALGLAFWVGRKISTPLRKLDAGAQAMGRGEAIAFEPTGLAETDRTAQVLVQASRRIHDANAQLESRVKEAVDQAERSLSALQQGQKLEALGRLTGGIAHDFNNLLQTLTTGLQLAGMTATDPRAKRAIDACNRSVQRGAKLTRQLMAFGRHKPDDTRCVDLRTLLVGMRELLDGALPSRIQLSLELPERPWPALVDPLQCELAVLNLVFNARDAMPEGGTINIALAEKDATHLQLSVQDSGPGMTADVQARALEPFFTTKAVGEGTGLGLAQVYGFAQQSAGDVELSSAPGEGCRVTLILPYSQADSVPESSLAVPRPQEKMAARLLLVDDDPLVREVIHPTLETLGYRVEVVDSADAALARVRETLDEQGRSRAFDLVFSDIVMPGELDGIGLALALRTLCPGLPVLLATGFSERKPEAHGFRVLAKPYTVEILVEALQELLDTPARE